MPEKLKKGWTRVAFGDVVRLCRERSSRPVDNGFDRYVGLEHLTPGELKIRQWGNTADGTTFTNVFRAGHVLFGKRRAYQRKVAVADFDGVCSGDIYVLKSADPKHLLAELLPFICQTDRFFDHAVRTSVGSLSPRTNWEKLASFEFALPPLDEQRRIVEVLSAYDSACESLNNLSTHVLKTIRSLARSNITRFMQLGVPIKPLSEIGTVLTGRTPRSSEPGYWGSDIPFATPGDMGFIEPRLRWCERGLTEHGSKQSVVVPSGSVLVVCIGSTIGKVARCDITVSFNQQINGVVPKAVNSTYLFMCLLECGHQLAVSRATTAVPIVNKSAFSQIRIPVPSLEVQQKTAGSFSSLLTVRDAIELRIAAARNGKLVLMQHVLRESL